MQWVVEDCLCLDANRLAELGIFKADWINASLCWESGANISLTYDGDAVDLRYSIDGEPHPQTIKVSTVPCHFGGYRYYFYCPGCVSRRYKLHLARSGFYCRECYRLPYYLQECGYLDGLIHKKHKLERKLENRSKYTRAKTFDRIIDDLEEAERKIDKAFLRRFGVLECPGRGLLD